jgi:hypothetical protein
MLPITKRLFLMAAAAGGAAGVQQLRAQTASPAAAGGRTVVLTMTGKVRGGRPVELALADIEQLPISVVRTTTPWHDGPQVFEGVALGELLRHVGAEGRTLRVTALNDYRTEVPAGDAARHGPILAYRRNGAPMPVRDKGPLFIIYPFDADPALRSEVFFGRSAWQVRSIEIE